MGLSNGRAALAMCDRCNRYFPYGELRADGNSPGLRVCNDDYDPKSPWRLPPARPDAISLKYPRPDTPLYPFVNQSLSWDQVGSEYRWDTPGLIWDDPIDGPII